VADTDSADGATTITLEKNMCFNASMGLLEKLKEAKDTPSVILDASDVEQMSTPATVVLLSALRSRENHTPPLAIKNAPPVFTEAFSDLGFFQDVMKMEFQQ